MRQVWDKHKGFFFSTPLVPEETAVAFQAHPSGTLAKTSGSFHPVSKET